MSGATRGRPQPTEKVTLTVGDKKVNVSYMEDDNRIQVSLPGEWVVSAMSATAGRKRLDLINMDNVETGSTTTGKEKPKAKAKTKTKAKPKSKESVDLTEDILPPNKTGEPPKRARRNKKTVFSG